MWVFGFFDFLGFPVGGFPGFSEMLDFTIAGFWDFGDYWCAAFFDFWTPGISYDSGVRLLRFLDCWMLGQFVAPSSRKLLAIVGCCRIQVAAVGC